MIEAPESVWDDIFRIKNKMFYLYKNVRDTLDQIFVLEVTFKRILFQPILLDNIRSVNSRIGQPESSFQIVTDREFIFRTSNPTLKLAFYAYSFINK